MQILKNYVLVLILVCVALSTGCAASEDVNKGEININSDRANLTNGTNSNDDGINLTIEVLLKKYDEDTQELVDEPVEVPSEHGFGFEFSLQRLEEMVWSIDRGRLVGTAIEEPVKEVRVMIAAGDSRASVQLGDLPVGIYYVYTSKIINSSIFPLNWNQANTVTLKKGDRVKTLMIIFKAKALIDDHI